MYIQQAIRKDVNRFTTICREHGIKTLYAFGSLVTDQFNPETSDIDLLVEMEDMEPMERGEKLLSLWDKLEAFFHRKVDLLTQKATTNPFLLESINVTKLLLYDNQRKKVLIRYTDCHFTNRKVYKHLQSLKAEVEILIKD